MVDMHDEAVLSRKDRLLGAPGENGAAGQQAQEVLLGPESAPAFDAAQTRAYLSRVVARICPARHVDRRDDIVQDAVLRVVQLARRRECPGQFSPAYLSKVAYSALIDEMRRLQRRGEVALHAESVGPKSSVRHPASAPHDSPEKRAESQELGMQIQDCLSGLSRDRRLAVTLYLQGASVPEAARHLGWGAKRTENLVFRGMADLRACLRAKGLKP